ncbi:MAG: hypothetical protein QOC63_2536 [Mycobacterium sp.]|nr:hypothetical protein [Mycobacterium sp.]
MKNQRTSRHHACTVLLSRLASSHSSYSHGASRSSFPRIGYATFAVLASVCRPGVFLKAQPMKKETRDARHDLVSSNPAFGSRIGYGGTDLGGAPSAAADSTNGSNVCHSSVDHGVEVDTCTGNPNGDDGTPAGPAVRVVPRFCFGLGFVSCDDDD